MSVEDFASCCVQRKKFRSYVAVSSQLDRPDVDLASLIRRTEGQCSCSAGYFRDVASWLLDWV